MDISLITYATVIVFGLLLFIVAIMNYAVGFPIFLATYPLIYRVPVIEGWEFLPAGRIIIFLLFILSLSKIKAHWNKIPFKFIIHSYGIYFTMLLISAMVSSLPWESFTRTMTYLVPVMFFSCALATVIDDKKGLKYITRGILASFAITCVYGLGEILFQQNYLVDLGIITQDNDWLADIRLGYGRITSFLGQPVYAALYFLFTIPIVYFIMKYYIRSKTGKAIIILLLLLSVVCIIYTGSRTGLIGLVMLLCVYYFLNPPNLSKLQILTLVVLMIGSFYYIAPEGFIRYNIASFVIDSPGKESQELIGRFDATYAMLNIARENIFFGLGPGFVLKLKETTGLFSEVGGMENQYAAVLADSGIVGFSAFLLFIGAMLKACVSIRSSKNYLVWDWANVVLSIIVVLLITSFTYGYLESIIFQMVMVYLGIELGLCYIERLEQPGVYVKYNEI